jgi:VanZ family protein
MKTSSFIKIHFFFFFWMLYNVLTTIVIYFSLVGNPVEFFNVFLGISTSSEIIHLFTFFVLSFIISIALRHSSHEDIRKHDYFLTIWFLTLFGALIEILQFFFPPRVPELLDLGYDFVGILLGQLLRFFLRKIKSMRLFL